MGFIMQKGAMKIDLPPRATWSEFLEAIRERKREGYEKK